MNPQQHQPTPRPLLQIVRGHPTPEEIAALVTVVSAHTTAAATADTAAGKPTPPRTQWASHHRRMRPPVHPSPNGWRTSAFAAGLL